MEDVTSSVGVGQGEAVGDFPDAFRHFQGASVAGLDVGAVVQCREMFGTEPYLAYSTALCLRISGYPISIQQTCAAPPFLFACAYHE